MDDVSTAFVKLAGIRKALQSLLAEDVAYAGRPIKNFSPREVGHYFTGTARQLQTLSELLPQLFGDFPPVSSEPAVKMVEGAPEPMRYSRAQLLGLDRTIDQALEVRAHSELAAPDVLKREPRVFISHGRVGDWREVQAYVEHDLGLSTLELAQEANLGRTVLQKLEQESSKCTSAIIVMTGDDADAEGKVRARENVLHEIGYLQAKFGTAAVCLLHEEGTNIPSNIHGLVYIAFPKGCVAATFGALTRELKVFYRLTQ